MSSRIVILHVAYRMLLLLLAGVPVPGSARPADLSSDWRGAHQRGAGRRQAGRPHPGGHTRQAHGHAQQEDDHTRHLHVTHCSLVVRTVHCTVYRGH